MNYIDRCPGCGRGKDTISMLAAYRDVYTCNACGTKYCCKCEYSDGARRCPLEVCRSTSGSFYGRVSK